jgi:protein TonB
VNPDAAPVAEPPALGPEQPVEPFDAPIAEGLLPGGDASAGLVDPFAIAPPPTPPARVTPAAPRRVGGAVRAPQKIHHVAPEYPPIARSARVTGVVILEAIIGEDGGVRNVTVLRSIPLLDNAAVEAVRQWRFTPSLLNGEPISVIMTVTVSFNLN